MAGIGAGIGVSAMISKIGTAKAAASQVSTGQVPGIYRTKVGKTEVASIFDGGMQMGEKIIINPNSSEVNRLKNKAFIQDEGIPGYLNTFVINTGSKLILVDTGASDYAPTTGRLIENLAAAGYKPDDVDQIFLTHAHPDHVKGLIDKGGQPVFKNATVHISERETKFWLDEANKTEDRAAAFDTAKACLTPYLAGRKLETFKSNTDFGGGITSVDLFGHTPGHTGFRISDGRDQLLIWGDVVHMQVLQFAHPEWSLTYDIDPEMAIRTRREILDEVTKDKIRVAGMHLGFPGIGHVEKSGSSGYAFVPQIWESKP